MSNLEQSKTAFQKYTEDAVQIESAILTIERTLKSIEEQKRKIKIEYYNSLDSLEKQKHKLIDEEVTHLEYLKEKQIKAREDAAAKTKLGILDAIGQAIAFGLGVALIGVIPFSILLTIFLNIDAVENLYREYIALFGNVAWGSTKEGLLGMLGVAILLFSVTFVIVFMATFHKNTKIKNIIKHKKNKAIAELPKLAAQISEKELNLPKTKQNIENEFQDKANSVEECLKTNTDLIEQEQHNLTKQLTILKEIRTKFYALNIIPLDYRTIDCAIVLNQIFRNDLADTMRDAVLLYDERVFRGIVIKGIGNILAAVNNLSADMQIVVKTVNSINHNVRTLSNDIREMSDELYSIRQSINTIKKENKKANDELIRETKASRYAAEQVAEGQRSLEHYMQNMEFYAQIRNK